MGMLTEDLVRYATVHEGRMASLGRTDDPTAGLMRSAATRIRELEGSVGQTERERESPAQRPSVGRIVHYVAYGTPGGEFPVGVCRAATITEVYDTPGPDGKVNMPQHPQPGGTWTFGDGAICTDVGVCVQNPTGLFFNRGIPYDPEKKPGTWHWPERT